MLALIRSTASRSRRSVGKKEAGGASHVHGESNQNGEEKEGEKTLDSSRVQGAT